MSDALWPLKNLLFDFLHIRALPCFGNFKLVLFNFLGVQLAYILHCQLRLRGFDTPRVVR